MHPSRAGVSGARRERAAAGRFGPPHADNRLARKGSNTVSPSRRDQTKSGKILVVDDEPAERDGVARLVGQWGYDVETAPSGEEALNLIETPHPGVVLTARVLPEMHRRTLLQMRKVAGR